MNMIFVQQNIIVVRCNVFNKKKVFFFCIFIIVIRRERGREKRIKEIKRCLTNVKWLVRGDVVRRIIRDIKGDFGFRFQFRFGMTMGRFFRSFERR